MLLVFVSAFVFMRYAVGCVLWWLLCVFWVFCVGVVVVCVYSCVALFTVVMLRVVIDVCAVLMLFLCVRACL